MRRVAPDLHTVDPPLNIEARLLGPCSHTGDRAGCFNQLGPHRRRLFRTFSLYLSVGLATAAIALAPHGSTNDICRVANPTVNSSMVVQTCGTVLLPRKRVFGGNEKEVPAGVAPAAVRLYPESPDEDRSPNRGHTDGVQRP